MNVSLQTINYNWIWVLTCRQSLIRTYLFHPWWKLFNWKPWKVRLYNYSINRTFLHQINETYFYCFMLSWTWKQYCVLFDAYPSFRVHWLQNELDMTANWKIDAKNYIHYLHSNIGCPWCFFHCCIAEQFFLVLPKAGQVFSKR